MKLKQISIAIENDPGRLFEVTEALGDAGINLRALTLVESGGGFGVLRILVSDVARTRRLLMEKNMPARVHEVIAVEIEDKPGQLAKLLKPLHASGVNVIYTYAFVRMSTGNAVMIFRFSDNDKAAQILEQSGIKLLDAESFGILEAED
ncbi:MAG: amino acid-binding protein [Desulfobacterales bacterium]|nr:amino acid-binding protein [Desulfobacterales bacterium]